MRAAVMFSFITWCASCVCSLDYECLLHTLSSHVCAHKSALEVRSARYNRYGVEALALSMQIATIACAATRAHVARFADTS